MFVTYADFVAFKKNAFDNVEALYQIVSDWLVLTLSILT